MKRKSLLNALILSFLIFPITLILPNFKNQVLIPKKIEIIATVTPQQSPTAEYLLRSDFQNRFDSLETMISVQTGTYSATISRWESNLNFILVLIGISAFVISLLGFATFKFFIQKQVDKQIKEEVRGSLNSSIEREIREIRKEWDPKFTEIYEEYRKTIKGK